MTKTKKKKLAQRRKDAKKKPVEMDMRWMVATWLMVVAASGQVTPATMPVVDAGEQRRAIEAAARAGLKALWGQAVSLTPAGGQIVVGFAAGSDVDGAAPRLYADESGAWADGTPIIDFQGRDGAAAAILTYLRAYQVLGDAAYRQMALEVWGGAETVADSLGGWPQDVGIAPDGTLQPATVWGGWGDRVHFVPSLTGCWTMDDATTQSMCVAGIEVALATRSTAPLQTVHNVRLALNRTRLGGVPQWMPLDRAGGIAINQNLDPRSPDGAGYMVEQTMNDGATTGWGRTLLALADAERTLGRPEIAAQAEADAERIARWLIGLPGPAWCQQYRRDDSPRWGRHNEPPVYITGELGVVSFLQHARRRFPGLRDAIDARLARYYDWLLIVPQPQPGRVWRYYAERDGKWLPAFGNGFELRVGEQWLAWAGGGQPYQGEFDRLFATRAKTAAGWDHARNDVYAGSAIADVVRLSPANIGEAPRLAATQVGGAWPSGLGGSTLGLRQVTTTSRQCLNTLCLIEWIVKNGKVEPTEPPKPPATQPTTQPTPGPVVVEPTADDVWFAGQLETLRAKRGGTIELKGRMYVFRRAWNLRGFEGLRIIGQGPTTRAVFDLTGEAAWCAIDFTASRRCYLADFDILTAPGKPVETLILLARERQAGGSHGEHVFERVLTEAHASIALLVNHGSEECVSIRCEWSNFAAGGGVFYTAHDPIYGARSSFGSFGGGSNTQPMRFWQSHLGVYGNRGDEVIVRVGPLTSWLIIDGGGASGYNERDWSRPAAQAAILLEPAPGEPIQQIHIEKWQSEVFGVKNYLRVRSAGGPGGVVAGLRIVGSQAVAMQEVFFVESGASLFDSTIESNYLIGGRQESDWSTPGDRPIARVQVGARVEATKIETRPIYMRHGAPQPVTPKEPFARWADRDLVEVR